MIFRDEATADTSPSWDVMNPFVTGGTLILMRGPGGEEILPPRFAPPKEHKERGRWWEKRSRGDR